ncbi:hypothetical protein HYE82_16300 [Streptomyces sp. BR123]|uniref:hypothetical protein n=1 Tax=Streptomyces sp. BR123 TaxID=2749828 RepID=UPI0015C46AD9|nr:hypothetical protein [Streptomyces sp. BR123]NXY95922.1 hypothetical protein [Streptomyces sp. BR123]
MTEQQEASEDALMTRIGQAVILLHAGDREEARNRLRDLWTELGEDGAGLHRCTLAHYMADAQDDPADELAWDLRALTAACAPRDGPQAEPGKREQPEAESAEGPEDRSGDGPGARPCVPQEPDPAVRVLYPSLHLSLAADYLKLQRPEEARIHLARAWAAAGVLPDDGYGDGVRAALARLERLLAGEAGGGPRPFPEQHP